MHTNRDHKSKSARLDKERFERVGSKPGNKHSKGLKPALHRFSGADPNDVLDALREVDDDDLIGGRR